MLNTSGIYAIKAPSGKMYVGSAVNLRRRRNGHRTCLARHIHHSPGLQAAFNKYGWDALTFEVLELVEPSKLIQVEQTYLDRLWPKLYNSAKIAGATTGYIASREARQKISAALTGHKRSPETRARMAAAQTGKKLSEATRAKISALQLGRKQPLATATKRAQSLTGLAHKDNTTGYPGVGKFRKGFRARWASRHLGVFSTAEEAYAAVCEAQDAT